MTGARAADDAPLARAIAREGLDSVEGAFAWRGGQELDKPGLGHRRRTRVVLADDAGGSHVLYLKRYGPAPARVLRAGRAAVKAANIRAVRAAGVPTMRVLASGEDTDPDGRRRSYLLVTAVPGDALERCLDDFLSRHEADGAAELLTRRLAELVRRLHDAGLVHRDLYASHVFLDASGGDFALYLIDLGRVFSPRWRRMRWRIKDLAQLRYSMPSQWVRQHWEAFLSAYLEGDDAAARPRYDRPIRRKVGRMRRRQRRQAEAGRSP